MITPDTNLLVRVLVEDDPHQTAVAQQAMADADRVVFTLPALCELVWVLTRFYKRDRRDIAGAMQVLLGAENAVVDRAAAEAGFSMLLAGGDFADGVIALEGARHGGAVFTSFDRQAVRLLAAQGKPALLLG
jgi:predicted nucleic-acid-binding protein